MPWSEGKESVGNTMSSMYVRVPVLSLYVRSTWDKQQINKTFKSLAIWDPHKRVL